MAETIGGKDLLGSGGHVWRWGPRVIAEKLLRSVGASGASRLTLPNGERPFTIAAPPGASDLRPLLRAVGATVALADAAMDALEAAIDAVRLAVAPVAWEDDCGRTGSYLAITRFAVFERYYGFDGTNWQCWAHYELSGVELAGRRPPAA